MNKLSYLRFGSVPKLLAGIWLMFALMVVFGTNAVQALTATPEPPTTTATIADIVVDGGFDTLLAALDAAGLTETFADPDAGPFTVFAPTNEAFSALPAGVLDALLADTDALTAVLQYHVIAGELTGADVVALPTLTTLSGEEIMVSVVNGSVTLTFLDGSAVVIVADIQASNGIVHVINSVLIPPPPSPPPTIAEIAVDGGFSTLVAALDAAGLTATFADPDAGPLTVFAPTNEAFSALPDGVLEALLADPTNALADILSYHVVAGEFTSADLVGLSGSLTTLLGEEITVDVVNGSVVLTFLNGESVVITADIMASNGVVHVIDVVLIPPPGVVPGTNVLPDTDGDGIPDELEDTNGDGDLTNDDADGDGIPDYLDTDSDNDGVPDSVELDANGNGVIDDSDGDGIPDYLDPDPVDSNGNGIPDGAEYDKDGDGVADDADGDGVLDYLDDDTDSIDSNGNGIPDVIEYDADGDGVPDDIDGDGILDYLDDFIPVPSISVLKAVQSSQEVPNGTLGTLMLPLLAADETLVFIIGVENTGNVPLTDVNVTDILADADSSDCDGKFPAMLDVGEKLTCIVTYVITDDDVNNGEVVNEAIVQSQYDGMMVENSAISTFPSAEAPGPLVLRKFVTRYNDIDENGVETAGDVLQYLIVAMNNGDSALSNVMITDVLPGVSGLICNQSGNVTLEPGEELTCRVEYTVTEADVEAGVVRNVAFSTADDPFTIAVQVDNAQVFVPPPPAETAVSLTNSSVQHSMTLLVITVVAIVMAQFTSYVTRREL